MLRACTDLLENELDLRKRKESSGSNMNVVHGKVADAKGDVKVLLGKLRWDTFLPYASVRQNVHQLLLT